MQALDAELNITITTEAEAKAFQKWDAETDVFVYCGEITYDFFDIFYDFASKHKKHKKVTFILSTPGGSADGAYRVARYLRTAYEKFTLITPTDCKSAGTLLACGAHEIAMTHKAEFGPLDVQVFSPDEFLQRSSGITITQALRYLEERAFQTWEDSFLKVRQRSGGVITTKTASEIAAAISVGIYSPISDKIDPSRIGDLQRSCDIALQYGIRLGMPDHMVQHLIHGYPSHGFAIDFREAKQIFRNVRIVTEAESHILNGACDITKQEFKHVLDDRLAWHEDYLISLDVKIQKPKKKNENRKQNTKSNSNSAPGGKAGEKATSEDRRKSAPAG
jgi:Periplasmic serine proteases (ClpP class)